LRRVASLDHCRCSIPADHLAPRALDLTLAKPRIVSTLLLEARIVATIETPSQGARA
jgi:hypothetical protein